MSDTFLDTIYDVDSVDASRAFYDAWAETYDAELLANGYDTPRRCADALARYVAERDAPIAELGCGTGLGGRALKEAGFTTIDGFDLSPEMLNRARDTGAHRETGPVDLSQPLCLPEGTYHHAAAIGALTPKTLPPTVFDEILSILPPGGFFVFSLNDHAIADQGFNTRLLELTELGGADLLSKEHGEHLPGIDLQSTVFVLRKR